MSESDRRPPSAPRRRPWYRQSVWTLIVPERRGPLQFSLRRLLGAFVFAALAAGTPLVVSWSFPPASLAWPLLTGLVLCPLLGAGVGLLVAGPRGAIAGALQAAIFVFVGLGVLFVLALLQS